MRGGAPRPPVVLESGGPTRFPDPRRFDETGLLAVGGDLSEQRLLAAYRSGVFPWYDIGYPPMWWSPDPRAVLDPATLHRSRSLRRVLQAGDFELGWNGCFERVMAECSKGRTEGTWIIPDMIKAYGRLHRTGHAHSLEVYVAGELVGGIYGVQIGAFFAAESKFHRQKDMSKVALVALVRSLYRAGIRLLDVQFATEHLARLGAVEIPRDEYLERLAAATAVGVDLSRLRPTID